MSIAMVVEIGGINYCTFTLTFFHNVCKLFLNI